MMQSRLPLYLCLSIRNHIVQSHNRFHPSDRNKAIAVVDGDAPFSRVVALNSLARAKGLLIDMLAVEAGHIGDVMFVRRDISEEKITKEVIIDACSRFTPNIDDSSHGDALALTLDISDCMTLFGGTQALMQRLSDSIRSLLIEPFVAISHNCYVAQLCATHARGTKNIIVTEGFESKAIGDIDVESLPINSADKQLFATWGIATLADLAKLPLNDLAGRLGPRAKLLKEMANGQYQKLFCPMELSRPICEAIDYESAVSDMESLLFSVSVLLQKLISQVQQKIMAISYLIIYLTLADATMHQRTIKTALPSVSLRLLLKLVQLDLEAHPPCGGVTRLEISVETGLPSKIQLGMFNPQLPEASQLDVTLARIAKIVGSDRVGSPVLENSYRQSRVHLKLIHIGGHSSTLPPKHCQKLSMRLIRSGAHLRVFTIKGKPNAFIYKQTKYQVIACFGPWHTSGKWWNESCWEFVHWDLRAVTSNDSWIHCCLSYDSVKDSWQLEGIYD